MTFLKSFLDSLSKNKTTEEPSVLDEVEQALSDQSKEESQKLAASALLLGRVAFADLEVSDPEKNRMVEILEKDLGLSHEKAESLAKVAVEKSVRVHMENHLVLRAINELSDRAFREKLLHALFDLASIDDISGIENETIRNISVSLGFSHKDFIQIRTAYRDHLSVLKP